MPILEQITIGMPQVEYSIHDDFRLILTTMPTPNFPSQVLQSGLKMTTEPPKGLKKNLKQHFAGFTDEFYDWETHDNDNYEGHIPASKDRLKDRKANMWRNLNFSLAFFHAVIIQRKKFGSLGWNIRYEFSNSDVETSQMMLKNFLNDNDDLPWDSLLFMTGEITYGGRVTDEWDRILLNRLLQKYYNEDVIKTHGKRAVFSKSGLYYVPIHKTLAEAHKYIDNLPEHEGPEIFGLHENSEVA
jgi:dynein heavy chain